RAWAINLGGTRTIRSPAASRSASSRRDRCRQSSTAQIRFGPNCSAHRNISRWSPLVDPVVVFTPSSRPTSSTATTVWERLCASLPTVTMIQSRFTSSGRDGTGRWAHLSGGDATLLSSHAGRFPASGGRQKACCPQEAPTLRAKPPDNDHRDTDDDATHGPRRIGD